MEYRKIKSLNFLYEINENGTILRNVKSKKHIKIIIDKHHSKIGYAASFICFKGKVKRLMIHKLVAECWLGDSNGLEIDHIDRNSLNNHYSNLRYVNHSQQMKNRHLSDKIIQNAINNCKKYIEKISIKTIVDNKEFPSMSKASQYLSILTNKSFEHIRGKMKQRRKNIYGYNIQYCECRDYTHTLLNSKE